MAAEAPLPGEAAYAPLSHARDFLVRLVPHQRILVALSGGSDSTGLLIALREVIRRDSLPFEIAAATVDHALRAESASEAAEVGKLCRELGIQHEVCRWEGPKPETGLMVAARLARYGLLQAVANRLRCDFVVTGHTQDDQLETVAMRRARNDSADARGLAGMAETMLFDGKTWIVRPFLEVRRNEIRALLRDLGIGWIDDPSNENERFERAQVRNAPDGELTLEAIKSAGGARREMACAAAALLDRSARSPKLGYFTLAAEAVGSDAGRLALLTLVAVAGGQPFLAGREQAQSLLSEVGTGNDFRKTQSRTVVERRKGVLHICREERDLPVVDVPAQTSVVWDGRVRVNNRDDSRARVFAGVEQPDDPEIPPRVAARLAAASADVEAQEKDMVVLQPYLAPFEQFLPGFDLELADAVAKLAGRENFPAPKFWNDIKK